MIRGPGPSSHRGERGAALLEAVVALAILALAIVGIVQAASGALRAQAMGRAHREATAIADAHLSALAAAPAESLSHYTTARFGETVVAGRSYSWGERAMVADDSSGIWHVESAVAWDGGRVALASAVYRPPRRLPGSLPR